MKKTFAFVALVISCSLNSYADTLDFPNSGKPMFRISIPETWEPDQDDDNVLNATSPEENVTLTAWELTSVQDAENVDKDIHLMLKDHAKKIKLDAKPEEVHPGGMDGLLFSGSAVDREDGHAIVFFALLVRQEGQVAIVFLEANGDTPEDEMGSLKEIMQSITPADGEEPLSAYLAPGPDSESTDTFPTDAPKIYAFFKSNKVKAGDKLKSVWIAEDIGNGKKNSKIDQASATVESTPVEGNFVLSLKNEAWPEGKYRVEIYLNDKLVETMQYTVAD